VGILGLIINSNRSSQEKIQLLLLLMLRGTQMMNLLLLACQPQTYAMTRFPST